MGTQPAGIGDHMVEQYVARAVYRHVLVDTVGIGVIAAVLNAAEVGGADAPPCLQSVNGDMLGVIADRSLELVGKEAAHVCRLEHVGNALRGLARTALCDQRIEEVQCRFLVRCLAPDEAAQLRELLFLHPQFLAGAGAATLLVESLEIRLERKRMDRIQALGGVAVDQRMHPLVHGRRNVFEVE